MKNSIKNKDLGACIIRPYALRLQLEHFLGWFDSERCLDFFAVWLLFSSSFGFSSPKEDRVRSTTMSSTDFFLLGGGMPAIVREVRGNIYS